MRLNKSTFRIIILVVVGIAVFSTGYSHLSSGRKFVPPPDPQYLINERSNIVESWVSETDINYWMVFNDNGMCYSYYETELTGTYTYYISNKSPQCGENVLVDESRETSYLQLTDVNDGTTLCYEINGVGELLSLSYLGTSRLLIFKKAEQNQSNPRSGGSLRDGD